MKARKIPHSLTPGSPVAQFELGSGHNLMYVVVDWGSRAPSSVVIDPQPHLGFLLDELEKNSVLVTDILLTHGHYDHVGGIPELKLRFPDARVRIHLGDAHLLQGLPVQPLPMHLLHDGEIVPVGALELRILHTPGHTQGGVCISFERFLFTGDTLFIGNCGRTDLPGGSNAELFASLQRLRSLPGDTLILPGHRYSPAFSATLSDELRTSPPLLCRTRADFDLLP